MPCCKSRPNPPWVWLLHGLLAICLVWGIAPSATAQNAQLSQLRVEQTPDGLYLSATVDFELPVAVEEALLKGVAMTFVAEAQVFRDRWYWYDKSVAQTKRSVRLAFQPLTRRWRVNVTANSAQANDGVGLNQNFDSLADAMSSVRRVARWKIAEPDPIDPDGRHNVEFRFRLDTSQLPRPMQIGITGNADWDISVQRNVRPER